MVKTMFLVFLAGALLLSTVACGASSADDEAAVDSYFDSVRAAFEGFEQDAARCRTSRDQPCLTGAVSRFRDTFGPKPPKAAGWMSDSHRELYEVLTEAAKLNRRAETDESPEMIQDSLSLMTRLEASFAQWVEQAGK